MSVGLGIDTGGTYTDAVLVDHETGDVLAGAKALTTHRDLSLGIGEAIQAVFDEADPALAPSEISLVGLSTTLATNAIVEGHGSPVCLILVGYDPDLIRRWEFESDLAVCDVVHVRGGHDGRGEETAPLDEEAVRRAVLERAGRVEAFAVSAYFGVRNPVHELRVRQIAEELTGLPVTCGHELTSRLDSVRRAATTALNARLIPLLRELISTVRRTLDRMGIRAPLMIVKGDGSLARAEWAVQRPIETILSGPAASVVGARHLAGRPDGWVIDMGGTTTDIAALCNGLPRLDPEGARVGRWRTMIETIDMHTAGLGGDSRIWFDDRHSRLLVGPGRVVPLCLLAAEHPEIVDELQRQAEQREHLEWCGQFVMRQRSPESSALERDRELLEQLGEEPRSFLWLAERMPHGWLAVRQVEHLEKDRFVLRAGFTPTDALHALGRFSRWNAEAARWGAELLALRAGVSAEVFCEQIVEEVVRRLGRELITKILEDEGTQPDWEQESGGKALLDRALGRIHGSALECGLSLRHPIIAVGAPVRAYLPEMARRLHAELVVPDQAEVANAVGAVVNSVVQRLRILVRPNDGLFRFHLPEGVLDFADFEEGVERARKVAEEHLRRMARKAGAGPVEVQVIRRDRTAPDGHGDGGELFVESELIFTAIGNPALAVERRIRERRSR